MANRETVVDDFADLNSAISTQSAAGGGIVRLDGLLTMTGDVTMASNVWLVGYGPGTGLVNSSANAYTIDFIGSTPAAADSISNPVEGTDEFTTSTAGDAADYTQGQWIKISDSTSITNHLQWVKVKTDGVAGTGVVKIFGQFVSSQTVSPTAMILDTPVENAGLFNCSIQNTSSGSITTNVQYANDIRFGGVQFNEAPVVIDESVNVYFDGCDFDVSDNLAFARHIELTDHVQNLRVHSSIFRSAIAGVEWNGTQAIHFIRFDNCEFHGCQYGIDFNLATPTNALIRNMRVTGCDIWACENPANGGGAGEAIRYNGTWQLGSINANVFDSDSAYALRCENSGTNQGLFDVQMVGNATFENGIVVDKSDRCVWGGMTFKGGGISLNEGPNDSVVFGCTRLASFSMVDSSVAPVIDNVVAACRMNALLQINSDNLYQADRNVFAANHSTSFLMEQDGSDNVLAASFIDGNVTFGTAGDTNFRNVLSGLNVDGNVTFTNTAQDYVITNDIAYDGVLTTLTGTGSVQADNANY